MNTSAEPAPSGDTPLSAVIAAYLEAADSGHAPDRGEVLAAHPDLAGELAVFFADLDRVDRLAAPLRSSFDVPTAWFRAHHLVAVGVASAGQMGTVLVVAGALAVEEWQWVTGSLP